jgi:hypothetical protein
VSVIVRFTGVATVTAGGGGAAAGCCFCWPQAKSTGAIERARSVVRARVAIDMESPNKITWAQNGGRPDI